MTITKGDRLPEATLFELTDQGPTQVASADVFKGKTVALFGLPGWGRVTGAAAAGIRVLGDSLAEMTLAMGLDFDGSARGLGIRCQRFSALIRDGEVAILNIEPAPGAATCTAGEALLEQI